MRTIFACVAREFEDEVNEMGREILKINLVPDSIKLRRRKPLISNNFREYFPKNLFNLIRR